MSFTKRHRLSAVPQHHTRSVLLLNSQATSGTDPPNVGLNGRVQKIGKPEQPANSQAPIKRALNIREARDNLFANTAGGTFGAKFDAFVDEIPPDCGIVDTANFVRIAGKRSRDNTASHVERHLPDIARKLEILASSAWKFKEISFILHGTQSCKESNDSYLRIMMTMSKIVTKTLLTREKMSSQNLGMIFYGLRSNKFKRNESKEMLSCLSRIVEKCSESFNAQEVGNALYGLQGMSSDDADVRSLVRALSGQVARCREPLSAQAVGNALYGLQGISSYDEGRCLGLYFIRTFIDLNKRGISVTPDYVSLCQSVVLVFPLVKEHLTDDEVKECKRIISDIDIKSSVSDDGVNSPSNLRFQSRSEQRMHTAAMKALGGSNFHVSHNEHLFGLFECDIVVRLPRAVEAHSEEGSRDIGQGRDLERERVQEHGEVPEEQSLIINIEVDGVHHQREKKKRFCRLRDEYLQSRGVGIARIEVSVLSAMSEHEVEGWVLDATAKALLASGQEEGAGTNEDEVSTVDGS